MLEVKETYKSHNENETFELMVKIKKAKVTVCPPAGLANWHLTVRKNDRDTFVYLGREKNKSEPYTREIKIRLFLRKLAVRVRVMNYQIFFQRQRRSE